MGTVLFGKYKTWLLSLTKALAKENRPQWLVADSSTRQIEHLTDFVIEFAGFEQFL